MDCRPGDGARRPPPHQGALVTCITKVPSRGMLSRARPAAGRTYLR
jgi:hypothetical protein